jgi:hypothetical protein
VNSDAEGIAGHLFELTGANGGEQDSVPLSLISPGEVSLLPMVLIHADNLADCGGALHCNAFASIQPDALA